MHYLALLRGINVGGNAKVSMPALKQAFTEAGFTDVATYINSGNLLFASDIGDRAALDAKVEATIDVAAGFHVPTILLDADSFLDVAAALPDDWTTHQDIKADVLFLWPEAIENLLERLPPRSQHDVLIETPAALLWKTPRAHISSSGLLKLVGTPLYRQMTVRNVNTVRTLAKMLRERQVAPTIGTTT